MQLLSPGYPPQVSNSTFMDHLDWLLQDGVFLDDLDYSITQTQNEDQLFTVAEFENGERLILVENVDA